MTSKARYCCIPFVDNHEEASPKPDGAETLLLCRTLLEVYKSGGCIDDHDARASACETLEASIVDLSIRLPVGPNQDPSFPCATTTFAAIVTAKVAAA